MSEFRNLLNEAAGTPPPLDMGAVHRRAARLGFKSRAAWWCAALAGVVGISGVTGAAVLSPADSDGGDVFASRVVGVEWAVRSVRTGAAVWEVPEALDGVVRFDGKGAYSGTACNQFGGRVKVSEADFTFGDVQTTSMACDGDKGRLDEEVHRVLSGSARWSVDDAGLRIVRDGAELQFRPRSSIFPTSSMTVVATSLRGEQWRVGYQQRDNSIFVVWEGRERPGIAWGTAGIEALMPPRTVYGMLLPFGRGSFVFAAGPEGSVSARFDSGGKSEPVAGFDTPMGHRIFAAPISAKSGTLVMLDAEGNELATHNLPLGPPSE